MSAGQGRALVMLPAFNEEGAVGDVIKEIQSCRAEVDVLVVNDGSTDRTAEVAAAAGARVLTLPFNLGVGGARRAAFRLAQREGYDRLIEVDADGQHDPREIAELEAALGDADMVIGARFAGKGEYRVRGPRWWAMRLLARVLSWVTKAKLTDVTSGYRVTNRKAISLFAQYYSEEYLGDTIEALVIAARAGLRVTQVPVVMRPRSAGEASQTPFRSALYLLRAMVALGLALVRRRPTVVGVDY